MTRLLAPFGRLQARPLAMKKKSGKISKFFSSIFPKFFSIEIILRECRLITHTKFHDPRSSGSGDTGADGRTDRRTNLISNQ